jgi:hypothetical protein
MTFGYLIWSRDLPASFAAGVVRRCGRIGRAQRSMRDTSQMVYERGSFGGRSSPISQPIVFSVVSGSGPSQSKHWNVRLPLPRGGSANVSGGLKSGAVPIVKRCRLATTFALGVLFVHTPRT